jgi:hypothetical protein
MAYYTNLLNMGEPVNVQPLPQPLLTSPFNYTDTGLLPIEIPAYTAPTPQPYTPIQPGPFGVQPVAPVAPVRRSFDTNAPTMEDIEDELGLAGTVEPTVENALDILGNLASFALGPGVATAATMASIGLGRNSKDLPSFASLAIDAIGGRTGGYDGFGNYGTGGVDPDAYADAVATAAWDDFGAAFDGPGTNDPGGFDFGDMSDFGGDYGGDAGDAGDGGTHICTAAFKAGISPKERFRQNRKYGIKLRREDPVLMRGYDIVGPWIAKKIGHTKMGNALTRLYAAKASGEKLSAKQKILDVTLNLTTRPALRLVGRFA